MDPTAPLPAPPSLTDLYVKARTAGMNDTDAALAVAQHLRQQADLRLGFREAGAIASGRPYDAVGDRASLMGEADRPLQDLAARRATAPLAMEEAKRQGELASMDIGAQQAAQLRDPSHPTNVATRSILARAGINVPPNTIAPTLPKELWEQVRPLVERQTKADEIAALAPGRAAEAGKARAETAKTTALTAPEAAKTSAEAEHAAAQAAVERQKLGGQVAPNYVRTGKVANVSDKEIEAFRGQATAAENTKRITGELTKLLGGKDFLASAEKRAKGAVLASKLLAASKEAMGIRGLPVGDVKFLEKMTGDFSAMNPSNLIGYTKNPTRLKTLSDQVQAELDSQAKTLGFDRVGGGEPQASNDDAAALQWAKAHSGDPRAARILKIASPKLAAASPAPASTGGP